MNYLWHALRVMKCSIHRQTTIQWSNPDQYSVLAMSIYSVGLHAVRLLGDCPIKPLVQVFTAVLGNSLVIISIYVC